MPVSQAADSFPVALPTPSDAWALSAIRKVCAAYCLFRKRRDIWNTVEPYIFQEREIRADRDFLVFYEDFVCRARDNRPLTNAYGLKFKRVGSGSRAPGSAGT